jgi:NADH-quinone oxidoreductase subunit N
MITLLILTAAGVLCLMSEIFSFKKIVLPIVLTGLGGGFVADLLDWNLNQPFYHDMMLVDNFAVAFTAVLTGIAFLWVLLSPGFFQEESSRSDHYALILFAVIGAQVMVSYSNMIMLFLGIEILSIPMYILAGSRKSDLLSNEAAVKYFLMGSFATGFLLFGIALIYGDTGSFALSGIAASIQSQGTSLILYAGILLVLVALAFKCSVAPFHFWAPDVYHGAPTSITAFMSTVVKTAAFAAFFRLFYLAFGNASELWTNTLWVLSAATILAGNITAVYQQNVKRMLAYSSIAHAGYMLMAILAMNNEYAQGALLFYTVSYSLSSLVAFVLLTIVSNKGEEGVEAFRGLAYKNPVLAAVTLMSVLSLAGIPPLAGFFAKYYIFSAALQNHYTWLVVLAIIGSLIGVYYYFRIVIALFREDDQQTTAYQEISPVVKTVLVLASLATLLFGLAPGWIVSLL